MDGTLLPGYSVRPVVMDDLPAMVDLFNAFSRHQVDMDLFTVERLAPEWTHPVMNLETNTLAVFTQDHQPVGYMEFWDMSEPHVSLFGWGSVHPDHFGKGISSFLVDWVVQRARENVHLAQEGARVGLRIYAESHNQAARSLFTGCGFQDIRTSYWMRIDFDQPPQSAQMPEGISVRPVQGEEDERAALFAAYEAFKDHWGHVDEPFESAYQRRRHFMDNDPDYDPSLWFMAMEGNQVAGVSLCQSSLDGNPDLGWVSTLGVLRPWRKRGLGLALLQHSFSELHKRGRSAVGLGVDASSLTGATRLYEKAGMRVSRRSTLYELELRPGKDLTTQSI